MGQSHVTVQLGEIANDCFVVMPFAAMFEREYTRVIKPAVESVGLKCVRGDEIYSEQSIVQDVWKSLRTCRVVVAELSGRNPNVMYEVGLAHAIGKPIILLTRNQQDVPFDLKSLRYVYYDTDNPDWGADLRAALVDAVSKVVANPTLAAHLHGVKVETTLPVAPAHGLQPPAEALVPAALAGVWRASWISVQKEREHLATLVIPEGHGSEFTAALSVAYWKESPATKAAQQTVVEETLKATLADHKLSLTGVSYTYAQRGASSGYTLDKFELVLAESEDTLAGQVLLKHGIRPVTFTRAAPIEPAKTGA